MPTGCTSKLNGATTATTMTACTTTGRISLSARPSSSAERDSGVTRVRSCEPVCISSSRFEPVIEAPNRQDITTMPGTNHCSELPAPSPVTLVSSGANRARKNSGWIIENTTENGSRSIGLISRDSTMPVSCTRLRRAHGGGGARRGAHAKTSCLSLG